MGFGYLRRNRGGNQPLKHHRGDLTMEPTGVRRRLRPDATLIPLEEFVTSCKRREFIDYDGFGYYSTTTQEYTDCRVKPSDVVAGKIDHRFTHISWYNR